MNGMSSVGVPFFRGGLMKAFAVGLASLFAVVPSCGPAGASGTAAASGSNGDPVPPSSEVRTEAERAVGDGLGKEAYTIGFVAKSIDNPVYAAARAGAMAAADEIGGELGVAVTIEWRAPEVENARLQVGLVSELLQMGVDGLAITTSDPTVVVPAIDRAAEAGVRVVTFDSDTQTPSRMAFFGIDDQAAGRMVMDELATALRGNGRVAILAGNRAASNLRDRVIGAAAAARGYGGIEIVDVFHHDETPEAAAAAMAQAHASGMQIDGWALMGGWPLYVEGGLDGVPEGVKVVSMDPLPPALDKMSAGRVQALVAQPYYRWGFESVRMLLERLHKGMLPEAEFVQAELEVVRPDGADSYRARWNEWVGAGAD